VNPTRQDGRGSIALAGLIIRHKIRPVSVAWVGAGRSAHHKPSRSLRAWASGKNDVSTVSGPMALTQNADQGVFSFSRRRRPVLFGEQTRAVRGTGGRKRSAGPVDQSGSMGF